MKQQTSRIGRKRKALLFLPLVTIPFLTLAFWALGGGRGETVKKETGEGLNVHLPDPRLKEGKGENKLSFYNAADKEAGEKERAVTPKRFSEEMALGDALDDRYTYNPAPDGAAGAEVQEEKIYRRIETLQRQLQNVAKGDVPAKDMVPAMRAVAPVVSGAPLQPREPDREDGQLAQLNAMMDKILDIQHPDRIRQRDRVALAQIPGVLEAEPSGSFLSLSLLDTGGERSRAEMEAAFHSAGNRATTGGDNTLAADIHETQKITDGAVVRLRLLEGFRVGSTSIPAGTFLYGTARQQGERLNIQITSLRYQNGIFPLHLRVYDIDGLEGIYMPGTLPAEAARGVATQSVQQIEVPVLDPSLKAKAATAGIEAARNLLAKKVKQKSLTVKGGYRVLLQNKKTSSNLNFSM